MAEINWDSLPDAPSSQPGPGEIDWDALPNATEEARKPRFDFESIKEDPLLASGKIALQGLGSVADLVKAGTDKVVAGVPLSESLDRYYKNDPSYVPGEATVEKFIPENVAGQTVAKTGLDIASDPTTWAAAYAKAAPKLAALVQKAEAQSPGLALRTLGKVGEFFTGGRMGPKWPQAVAKFSPMERIKSGTTLDEAADAYHPMKKAADDFMSGRLTPKAEELFQPVRRYSGPPVQSGSPMSVNASNQAFNKLDEASQYFDDAINKLGRMRDGAETPAEIRAVQKLAHEIQNRGVTAGPQTAEGMDFLNNLEFTGMGNPKLVKDIFKGPQAQLRGALKGLTEESGPVYSSARQRFSDAKTMVAPPTGGKMGKYMIQNAPTMAATAGAAGEIAGGRWGDAAKVAGSIIGLRNPKAYNVAAGIGGGLNQGTKAIANAAIESLSSQPGKQAVVQSFKGLDAMLFENPQAFGQFSQTLQEAKQRGPEALQATDHILQQTKPEYRAIKRQINGQEEPYNQ